MDRHGRHVLRGCGRISDLEIALQSQNPNRASNAIVRGAAIAVQTHPQHPGGR
jgi:hypothetical protein